MGIKFTNLQCKEVICVSDGRRLGFIEDLEVEVPEGTISAILVPGPGRLMGLGPCKHRFCIPWHCIRRIGPDIVLVDVKPEDCQVGRPPGKLPFSP